MINRILFIVLVSMTVNCFFGCRSTTVEKSPDDDSERNYCEGKCTTVLPITAYEGVLYSYGVDNRWVVGFVVGNTYLDSIEVQSNVFIGVDSVVMSFGVPRSDLIGHTIKLSLNETETKVLSVRSLGRP